MAQEQYVTVAEFLDTYDNRLLEQLGIDSSSGRGTLDATNTILVNALLRASADLEASALVGERYTIDQLTEVKDDNSWILKGIVSDRAIYHLAKRRGGRVSETIRKVADSSEAMLERLRDGVEIFNLSESAAAGVAAIAIVPTSTRIRQTMQAFTDFFPPIQNTPA